MEKGILSDGEWKLMKLLWKKAPRTIGEMVSELDEETSWSRTTVFVMLKRLIAKEAVRMDDSGQLQQYYPVLKRKEVERAETDSFLSRVYDGSVGFMVSSLVGRRALTDKEIRELRAILEEAEKKGGA